MTTLMELQGAIDHAMRRGKSFSTVEDQIIEPSQLSDEAKSALWLYAWSFVDRHAQRREASAHIAQIVDGPDESLVDERRRRSSSPAATPSISSP
jgi:hypothetical protein